MASEIGPDNPREPTSDECDAHAPLGNGWYAIWFPQMGGYVGHAAVWLGDECVELCVWHDGEFPFTEGDRDCDDKPKKPARLHLCDPDQWIRFGEEINALEDRVTATAPSQETPPR